MESAWRNANSQTQQSDPTTLTTKTLRKPHITNIPIPNLVSILKKDSIAHKSYKGATETLNTPKTQAKPPEKTLETNIHTQSQRNLPNKPKTTKQSKRKWGEGRDREHTECKLANGDEIRSAVTVMTRVLPVENLRASVKNEDMQKVEEKALPGKTHKEKMQEEGTVCYL